MNKSTAALLLVSALLIPAMTGCGSSGSDSIEYTTMNYPDEGSTGLTGIRGITNSSDVYITGSFFSNGLNTGTLYVGPITGPGDYFTFLYPGSDGTNVYSAENGLGNTVKLVGTYTLEETGARAYGFLYNGPITDGRPFDYQRIDYPDSQATGPVINTYPHSIMGDLVVGNYDTPVTGGNGFIYEISTGEYFPVTNPGSRFTSLYGVWWNGGTSYTMVGGYTDADYDPDEPTEEQLTTGLIFDYDALTGEFSNWTALEAPDAVFTHFEGITTDGNGGYNLAAGWLTSDGALVSGFTSVPRDSAGGFNPAQTTWISVLYPGSTVTTGDTVYRNYVLGIYTMPDSSATNGYVAEIPTSWY